MSIKTKLTIVNFFQLFVWGAWLITIANYWFNTQAWDGKQFGAVFSTMGIASIIMPTVAGIIADKWINAEKLYGILHILYAGTLFLLPQVGDPNQFFWVMLLAMFFYMPTLALNNAIAYTILKNNQFDVVKAFPPIRVFGTIGFIAAMWMTNLTGNKDTAYQFYIAGTAALGLGLYAFTLPKCPPTKSISTNASWKDQLGLSAFKLFSNYKMAVFLVFSMFLGAALQLTNAYGDLFLSDFAMFPKYANSVVVERSTIIMSISQISETLFILAIPFFLKRFGIKNVMLMAMVAWVLRFGLFAYGNPAESLWMIIMSCIVYGMAFDFFNISGSLFVETETKPEMRSSAQGLFMMMTNGFGAILGSISAGWLIDGYFTLNFRKDVDLANYLDTTVDNLDFLNLLQKNNITLDQLGNFSSAMTVKDWPNIWLVFAGYALVITVLFAIMFRYKQEQPIETNSH